MLTMQAKSANKDYTPRSSISLDSRFSEMLDRLIRFSIGINNFDAPISPI